MKRNINKSFETLCAIFILFSLLLFKNALLIMFLSLALLIFGLVSLFKNNSVKMKS
ncbi:hypothetical protein [Clostridium sp. LIBA-8841]|uniref:hypothetical protein n=1 Tax=Clostridium sp. LIBA-8841 TaxID=2987530 RepID=UPI002AC6E330|nr:hypothetical protein [Clostridium sp. LIBA-8841]MDZ5253807.1 hypothetical protein [Clostridium sp. LIBA-8841]